MNTLQLTAIPEATTGMLIRKPVAEVFEAFIDPAITSKFWFSRGSDRLAPGKQIDWHWEMYGMSTVADVKQIEQDKRVLVEWSAGEVSTMIEWQFESRDAGTTFVTIINSGFSGSGDEVCQQMRDSTEGFTFALAGLKAWLEHGVELNLIPDRFPDAHVESWQGAQDGG